jgi:hypothetical protein
MAAILVIVGEVVAEQTTKVIGVEHYDVIEELAADAEHPPFAYTVLPGRPRGDAHRVHLGEPGDEQRLGGTL